MQHQQKVRYSRHLILPELGEEGQTRLLNASALVIGAGGLGSPALLYLAASGVGRIGIIDSDKVELSNLQRQVIHETSDIGRWKAESAADSISDLNPDIKTEIYKERLTEKNAEELIKKYDAVLDGSDNFETRFLVNDVCVKLKKPLVTAAILRFEGQVTVFDMEANSPCYRCLYAEVPPAGTMPTCESNGIFSPVAGIAGTIQAAEAVKLLAGIKSELRGNLLVFDGLKMNFRKVKLNKDKKCGCNN